MSRHLAVLLKAGIVDQRKDSLKMIYSLKTPCILNFAKCVEGVICSRVFRYAGLALAAGGRYSSASVLHEFLKEEQADADASTGSGVWGASG